MKYNQSRPGFELVSQCPFPKYYYYYYYKHLLVLGLLQTKLLTVFGIGNLYTNYIFMKLSNRAYYYFYLYLMYHTACLGDAVLFRISLFMSNKRVKSVLRVGCRRIFFFFFFFFLLLIFLNCTYSIAPSFTILEDRAFYQSWSSKWDLTWSGRTC